MTRSSFTRLAGVLQLEAQQGYKNKAVVGGIRQFVTFWVEKAREEAIDEADLAFVEQTADLLSNYGNLPGTEARGNAVGRLLEKLAEREIRAMKRAGRGAGEKSISEVRPSPVPSPPSLVPSPPPPAPTPPPLKAEKEKPEKAEKPKKSKDKERPSSAEGFLQPVTNLYGVGPRIATLLAKLGVQTVADMLYLFPRRYDDYSLMKPINKLAIGEKVTLIGTIWEVRGRRGRTNQETIHAVVTDGTGQIQVTWFNQPWLLNKLRAGLRVVMQGTVEQYLGRPVFNNPDWEMLALDSLRTGAIVPIYPLTHGLSSHRMRQMMQAVVDQWANKMSDPLPRTIAKRQDLPSLAQAIRHVHQPESQEVLLAARRRLIFDELFLLQLGMLGQRRDWQAVPARPLIPASDLRQQFIASLPYALTGAQGRVIEEIAADLAHEKPMSRMLQGDVGAGKTVVAAAALVTAVAAGAQGALMAPTEILAEQHYRGLSQLLEPLGITAVLLTGSKSAGDKRAAYEALASGQAQVAIGTHALIQPDVAFANLGLTIVDEQHRFGVNQRKALKDKGPDGLTPHMLVMSATPIPRSLALSLYGDLDLSVLDEMPPGRQEIKTRWVRPSERWRCYDFVRRQVNEGRQAFVICPLVEESDKIEATAAVEEHERLQKEIFPEFKLGLVHGKMPASEKEAVMRQFYNGELHLLVSTSVIEVGVDVPNSTVMMIEGANRFGLAQLHQFRGRVGRGQHQSYCLLIADDSSPEAEARLVALEQTNDGFQLAEKDLELRGPGEFFGQRQSGLPELKLASLSDMTMLTAARSEADLLLQTDPFLEAPEHLALQERVRRFWENAGDVS
ncbi:MAG: ATP-dependent DNA helicase RecG [Chloroflexi bacterium]|nr:ATP-dependent DNA helicase RecG [Chloroflexota bacterium]